MNLYGPIEITVDCTYFVVDREFDEDQSLPIGFPCRNTSILILNENNEPCVAGERGELCVRGSSLAFGYWNDPAKTAKAFVQNPLNNRYPELIYRTGDLVYRNERGEIMFVGRTDYQIKHLGYRIELPEIEHQVDAEVAGPFEAAWLLSAYWIPEGVGDERDTRIDAAVLEPRTCAQPVSQQVAAWQNELEGDIGQAARGGRSARGVMGLGGRGSVWGILGVGGDRPAEDHQNAERYVITTPPV